jgi:hypothetical protein
LASYAGPVELQSNLAADGTLNCIFFLFVICTFEEKKFRIFLNTWIMFVTPAVGHSGHSPRDIMFWVCGTVFSKLKKEHTVLHACSDFLVILHAKAGILTRNSADGDDFAFFHITF